MESFGFGNVHVAVAESPYELALSAATRVLDETGVDRESIGLLIYGGTPGSMSFAPADEAEESASGLCTMSRFKYPATRLQYDLDLPNAWPFAVDQLACTTLLGAARIARSLCLTEGIERALCVSAEFFPANAGREAIFNCNPRGLCRSHRAKRERTDRLCYQAPRATTDVTAARRDRGLVLPTRGCAAPQYRNAGWARRRRRDNSAQRQRAKLEILSLWCA